MFKFRISFTAFVLIASLLFLTGMIPTAPAEGMYPLSEIHKLNLKDAGLKINLTEIYNPEGVGLVDALVKVGGCTGSFVSGDGLILTNHHCAFRALNKASTTENNYLENGFLAKSKEEEIPAEGYTCRITESYEDVSDQVLSAIEGIDNLAERSKIISEKMEEIGKAASSEDKSIIGQVSEMFKGKTYVLFKYRVIKDVRLVFAPPRTIGEFGGETDNWIWPRHSGDFTFMRAYVAPDGSAAEYSKDNVPYKPKKYLKINPNGVNEGDFVFILGYPGRTYRNRPSQFLEYQNNYQLPYIAATFEWMIEQLENIGKGNPELELKFATQIKRLANTMKNYKGKLLGLKRIPIIQQKKQEENELQKFIDSNPELKSKYGRLLYDIDIVYNKIFQIAQADLWFRVFNRFSITRNLINTIFEFKKETEKPEDERKEIFKDSNRKDLLKKIDGMFSELNKEFERRFLAKMFTDALNFKSTSKIKAIEELTDNGKNISAITEFVDSTVMKSEIFNKESYLNLLFKEDVSFETQPLFVFFEKLKSQNEQIINERDKTNGALTKLSAELIEVKRLWKNKDFIPDANGTLRLTYGRIKGYSPADAVYYSPVTSLKGVIEKSYLGKEYQIPQKLRELFDLKEFGKFYSKKINGVPVNILYNTDTTGGNSGSPIMNAYGELIGLNFDRAFEATINDFAWNDAYSRSIGVDIRYILWITHKFSGATDLMKELGVM